MHLPSCREALQTDLRLLFCNLDTAPQLRRKSLKSDCRLTSSLFFFSTDTSSLCLKKRASGVSEYRVKSTEITGTLKQWMCEDAEKQSGCRPVDVRNVEGRRASQNEGACGTGMSKAQENWIGRNFVSIDVQLISCLNIDYGIRQWKTFKHYWKRRLDECCIARLQDATWNRRNYSACCRICTALSNEPPDGNAIWRVWLMQCCVRIADERGL